MAGLAYLRLCSAAVAAVGWHTLRGVLFVSGCSSVRTDCGCITSSNPDFQTALQLARRNPIPGDWTPIAMEEVEELEAVDNNQFVLVTDTRILDLRAWEPGSLQVKDPIVSYRRMMVRCKSDQPTEAGTPQNLFRFQQSRPDRELEVRYDSIELNPRFRFTGSQLAKGNRGITTEAEFDLSTVLVGKSIEIGFEILSSGLQGKENQLPILQFPIVAETKVASMWVLLPEDKHYDRFELLAFDVDSGNLVKAIEPTYSFRMADRTLFGWMFVDTSDQFLYECLWNYRER